MAEVLLRQSNGLEAGRAAAADADKAADRESPTRLAAPQGSRVLESVTRESTRDADDSTFLERRAIDRDLVRVYRRLALGAACAVAAIGAIALIGWFGGVPVLTSFRADWVSMKANTGAALVVAAIALLLSLSGRRSALLVAQLCSAFVAAVGGVSLSEYALDLNLGIDQLLVTEPSGTIGTVHPGRMAVVTAASLILCGVALLGLGARTLFRAWYPSALAVPVLLVSTVAILGYAFGAEELYTYAAHISAIAAPTALALVLLSVGIILARVEDSIVYWLASPYSGGIMLRRLLPFSFLVPALIVSLRLFGQAAGIFHTIEFGAASIAVAMMVSAASGLVWCAALLERLDRQRLFHEQHILQLDAELHRRLTALEVVNKELEGFSYATSHVLQAPLRAIDGFATLLLEEYSGSLDNEGKRLLGTVRSNAREMRELIDGILGFLRLGREAMSFEPIDMNTAVQLALKELEPKTRGRKLKIEISPLPPAYGDRLMIQQVWINLLDNAIKFTLPRSDAMIQVGAASDQERTIYHVRDNGVGFDMKFAGTLFGVFNRLHGAEFPGNGMGLAVVRRVLTRHGGRIRAEGKPGEGATFFFNLPGKANKEIIDVRQRGG